MDIFVDSKFEISSFSGGISSLIKSDFKEDLNFWNPKNKNDSNKDKHMLKTGKEKNLALQEKLIFNEWYNFYQYVCTIDPKSNNSIGLFLFLLTKNIF